MVLYSTPVQGEGAAGKIAEAIGIAANRNECDVLILCRGGGSIEDLWQFNQEIVARAVFDSPIPIVCGVGHETDFTIADFVADQRAPTPTAAAEMVSPNRLDLQHKTEAMQARLARVMARTLEMRMQHIDHLTRRLVHPGERLLNQRTHLTHLEQRLRSSMLRMTESRRWHLEQVGRRLSGTRPDVGALVDYQQVLARRLRLAGDQRLDRLAHTLQKLQGNLLHLNPQSVLERGYSMVQTEGGRIVKGSGEVAIGDTLKVTFAKGWANTQVTRKGPE